MNTLVRNAIITLAYAVLWPRLMPPSSVPSVAVFTRNAACRSVRPRRRAKAGAPPGEAHVAAAAADRAVAVGGEERVEIEETAALRPADRAALPRQRLARR